MTLLEQFVAACGVILLVVAVRLAARPGVSRKWWPSGLQAAGRNLESVGQVRLTPQHSIHLVRCADKTYVIATHASGCTLLDQVAGPCGAKAKEHGEGAPS